MENLILWQGHFSLSMRSCWGTFPGVNYSYFLRIIYYIPWWVGNIVILGGSLHMPGDSAGECALVLLTYF